MQHIIQRCLGLSCSKNKLNLGSDYYFCNMGNGSYGPLHDVHFQFVFVQSDRGIDLGSGKCDCIGFIVTGTITEVAEIHFEG